jgi:hypothetical protein
VESGDNPNADLVRQTGGEAGQSTGPTLGAH